MTGFPLFVSICIGALTVVFFLWAIASALHNAPKTYPPGSTPESIGLAAMKEKERTWFKKRYPELGEVRSDD